MNQMASFLLADSTPRVQFFLWLLIKSNVVTTDNLAKRQNLQDRTCSVCEVVETSNHLYCECMVAKLWLENIWRIIEKRIGCCFEFTDSYLIYKAAICFTKQCA